MSGCDFVLQVAFPLPIPQLFDYHAPAGSDPGLTWPGRRVRAPFGRAHRIGIVTAVLPPAGPGRELKPIEAVLDPAPLFAEELWQTLHWASGYYHRALGDVLATALPQALRTGAALPDLRRWGWSLTPGGADTPPRQGTRTRAVHDLLAAGAQGEAQLDLAWSGWREPMRRLAQQGRVMRTEMPANADALRPPNVPAHALNAEQQDAVDRIVRALGGFRCMLLDGVTGSGKTEVYLAAIEACLARGQQTLVLVPEIGLTPQALRRYGDRLTVPVHALHSGLSETERLRSWQAMANGEARVLIGTRSAVFAPLPAPGLIIVDEEHDASYKQQDGFRYHARDLALVRAKALDVPVVLGSATPSLESIANARQGRYLPLRLSQRAGAARPPSFHVIDVRSLPLRDGLSAPLLGVIGDCVARGEQALVFRNRRGYAPCLLCHDCGWSAQCERCDAALTLHGRHRLLCHHCGARRSVPAACPQCQGLGLVPQGVGTERLERALAERFPDAPLVRVDRETTQHRDALERHFERLGDRAGILVGTQMLAKGHDLPNLTVVAIADVDEGLFSADFRAAEHMAQLLIQVAGRAGRAHRPGSVWLQTHHPLHGLLQTLLHGGYAAFADAALAEREAAGFPPFAHLALLRAEATRIDDVDAFLRAAREQVPTEPAITVHAPMPAPMPRRAGRHRGQMLVSAGARGALQAMLRRWVPGLHAVREARRVRWSIDVDPTDLY